MSLKTWKSVAYPVTAEAAATDDITATKHALVKWEHLRPEVLEEHNLKTDSGDKISGPAGITFGINSESCALCARHMYSSDDLKTRCHTCPIYAQVGRPCGEEYVMWLDRHDPEPMIDLLKRTLARLEAGEGGGERCGL